MAYGDVDKMVLNKVMAKRALDANRQTHSFTPKTNKSAYQNVPSKLALARSPEDYIARTRDQSTRREIWEAT